MKTRKLIPMLFSTEMARANMEGRKTETRRKLKVSLPIGVKWFEVCYGELNYRIVDRKDINTHTKCPYGQRGDVLWMRESFLKHPLPQEGYKFKSDYTNEQLNCGVFKDKVLKWKPAIHMPLEACRFFAEITEIRVERLHDITNKDAIQEGIEDGKMHFGQPTWLDYEDERNVWTDPVNSYKSLWAVINGPQSWEQNPWVWVVKYLRLSGDELYNMMSEIIASRKSQEDKDKVNNAIIAYSMRERSMV